jgi:uncharacterized protein YjaG (DUF416 family)
MSKIETNVVKPEIKFVTNENEYTLIDTLNEATLDNAIVEIEKFINQSGKGKTDSEKDELYQGAQDLWNEYAGNMKNAKYNFHLSRPQWKFLTDLLLSKLEYDVNTVFFAIELVELLGTMRDMKFSDDKELRYVAVNATEITYVYHLISKHKVKGLTKDSFLFSEILMKIGDISKIFNYYDAVGKNLSVDIQNWVATFEEGVEFEKSVNVSEEQSEEA